jgi:hypothetical protein
MQLKLSEFHKRSTYQEIADEITNPKEKIQLADLSMAKQFTNTQQGSRFDDDNFINLENDHTNKLKQQQQQQNMQAQAAALGVNVAAAMAPPAAPPTSQQAQPVAPINPKTSTPANQQTEQTNRQTSPVYHDLTSGDREEQEEEDMEEALRASKESEQKRKNNAADLVGKNLGADFEGVDTDYVDKLVRESGGGGASSSGAAASSGQNPETETEPKGKRGKPRSNQNLRNPEGLPKTLKPPHSRSPSRIALEKKHKKRF